MIEAEDTPDKSQEAVKANKKSEVGSPKPEKRVKSQEPGVKKPAKKSEVGSRKSEEKLKAQSRKRKAVVKPEEEEHSAIDIPHSELKTLTTDHSPLTTKMEVHHHPQLDHKPKPWKEYVLEGLMIFLAVTMGFFAENLRESIPDNRKIHEYMQSMVSDLQSDITLYKSSIDFNWQASRNIHLEVRRS